MSRALRVEDELMVADVAGIPKASCQGRHRMGKGTEVKQNKFFGWFVSGAIKGDVYGKGGRKSGGRVLVTYKLWAPPGCVLHEPLSPPVFLISPLFSASVKTGRELAKPAASHLLCN